MDHIVDTSNNSLHVQRHVDLGLAVENTPWSH